MTLRIFVAFHLVLIPISYLNAQLPYRTVALTGQQAPGTQPGVIFDILRAPAIANNGDIAFPATLGGASVDTSNNISFWREKDRSSIELVAREGDASPDGNLPFAFSVFDPIRINNNGRVAFNAIGSLFSDGSSGVLELIAKNDQQAPGLPVGETFQSISRPPLINDAGNVAFNSQMSGIGSNSWSNIGGTLAPIYQWQDQAPGTPVGVKFQSNGGIVGINNNGQVAISSALFGTGVTASNSSGIWVGSNLNTLSLVARTGITVPNGSGGRVFEQFYQGIALNDGGQVAFRAALTGSAAGKNGIWASSALSQDIRTVARNGDSVPGVAGATFNQFQFAPLLDAVGRVAFSASFQGTGVNASNNTGFWYEKTPGGLELIVREGDHAPGTDASTSFSTVDYPEYVLNNSGQIAFRGFLIGPNVNSTNDYGLWAADPSGSLWLVAREGDLWDVNDDPFIEDLRTIATLTMNEGVQGIGALNRSFNTSGELAFHATFTDGSSGIFVTTVPEPSTISLIVLGSVLLWRARRKTSFQN